jgi:hypothetical protein
VPCLLVLLQLGEIIDLPEYPDCEWHTSAHVIINLRMVGGVPSYTVWSREHPAIASPPCFLPVCSQPGSTAAA